MNHNALPGHELTELPNPNSTARLLDTEPAKKTHVSQQQNSKFWDFLRHVRLLLPGALISHAFAWRSPTEQRKVAAYQSRCMAAFNSLLHVVPLSGAVTLLLLNWSKHWVGGNSDNATSLQFVSKFHELFMQASLLDIILYLIRAQALSGYIPLGALSGAAQAPQLSYLWSLDFISAIRSPAFSNWRKVTFALSISGLLLMTAFVGPSSAVLMIPRPGMPLKQNTTTRYLNITEDSVYPDSFHVSKSPDVFESPEYIATWEVLRDLNFSTTDDIRNPLLVGSVLSGDHRTTRSYRWPSHRFDHIDTYKRIALESVSNTADAGPPKDNYAIITIPSILSTEKLWEHSHNHSNTFGNNSWTLWTLQPFVLAVCGNFPCQWADDEVHYLKDDGSQGVLSQARELWKRAVKEYILVSPGSELNLPPIWMASPENSSSLVGVWPRMNKLDVHGYNFTVCTVSSFWRNSVTSADPGTEWVVQTDFPASREAMASDDLRPITIDLLNTPSLSNVSGDSAAVVAWSFAAEISEIPDRMVTANYDYLYLWYGIHQPSDYDRSELPDSTASMAFEIVTLLYGYGYSSTNMSIRLSLAVIVSYCVITVLYIAYIIITGHTSIAWNSPTELIVLALQSKAPDHLGPVSVGIDTMETLQENVGIRVNTVTIGNTEETREVVEMVFAHDGNVEKRGLTKVERNKAY